MPLRDTGITQLHDLYFTLASQIEGLLKEMDKIVTTEDGEDIDALSDVVTLLSDTIQEFSDDADIIYAKDFVNENDTDFSLDEEFE